MCDTTSPPEPTVILDLLEAFRWSKTMFAAVGLGVFDALAGGGKSAATLATELRVNADALERLLGACVVLQLLRKNGDQFENTPAANAYLTQSSPARLTGYINYSNTTMWKLWANLEDAIREGTHRWKQTFGWDRPIFANLFSDEHKGREFLLGMHGFGLISSPHVVTAFDLSRFRCLCDLGGATGHLAIAACRRCPELNAIVFDLPEAMPLAHKVIGASTVAKRIKLVPGDFFVDALPQADLFALGRIVHDWSEAKIHKLLSRIYQRLPSGGGVLIAEKILLDDKTGPRWAQMQNLNMLTCTEGKERTLAEYEVILSDIGFIDVQGCRTPSPLDAILAIKP